MHDGASTEEQLTQIGTSGVWAGNVFGLQGTFVDGQGNPTDEKTDHQEGYTGDPNTGSTCP